MEKLLPIIMIFLQFGAALIYLFKSYYGNALYWIAAGLITYLVTFGKLR